MSIITLTTDFGVQDWFVGTMKGVVLGIAPRAQVVDITHEIAAGDIAAGAFALAQSCRFFPRGTVHVAVVDPGVGSARSPIVVETKNYFFVGPDNGVLSLAVRNEKIKTIRKLQAAKFFLPKLSRTFHGRDVFAPVAAHLSNGVACRQLGPEQTEMVPLPWREPVRVKDGWRGEVVYIDRYGNAITNLPEKLVGTAKFLRAGKQKVPVQEFYQAVPVGKPVAVLGSSGFLEVAINGGNAAKKLRLKRGQEVALLS